MENENIPRDGFVFYRLFLDMINDLPSESQLQLYSAIAHYAIYDVEPVFTGILNAVWTPIKDHIDRNIRRYDACRRNGSKGGAPKGSRNNPNGRRGKSKQELSETNQELTNELTQELSETNLKEEVKEEVKDKDNIILEPKGSSCDSDEPHSATRQKPLIDIKSFILFFNAEMEKENAIIKRVISINGNRRTALFARAKEYGKEAVAEVVRKAARSLFLNGHSDRGWVASFDWIMRPNNFPKVLEGEYDNETTAQRNETKQKDRYRDRRGADSAARSAEDYTDTI